MEKKKRSSQTQLTKDNVEDFEKQDETGKYLILDGSRWKYQLLKVLYFVAPIMMSVLCSLPPLLPCSPRLVAAGLSRRNAKAASC